MLTVNCAAIPVRVDRESIVWAHEGCLHRRGQRSRRLVPAGAHRHALFLDEIGELTLEGQAKLLRILEGHPFLPVGGTREIHVDVRVIAATNRDLAEFVREKRLSRRSYSTDSVFSNWCLPPLRERGDDVDLLIDHFSGSLPTPARPRLARVVIGRRVHRLREYMFGLATFDSFETSSIAPLSWPTDNEIQPDDLGLARRRHQPIGYAANRRVGKAVDPRKRFRPHQWKRSRSGTIIGNQPRDSLSKTL